MKMTVYYGYKLINDLISDFEIVVSDVAADNLIDCRDSIVTVLCEMSELPCEIVEKTVDLLILSIEV